MEAVLMLVAQLAHRFGADPKTLLAVLLMTVGFGVVGASAVLVYYWLRSRIAIAEREAVDAANERRQHMDALTSRANNADARLQVLMNGKLEGLTQVVTKTGLTLDAIGVSLVGLHDKEEARAGKLYEKLDAIRLDIAKNGGGGQ